MLGVSKVRIKYLNNPVGLSGEPWFGWILESERRSVRQKSYFLEVSENLNFEPVCYRSGWVDSPDSVHIRANGLVLQSCRKYYVRVRVRDEVEESSFSDPSYFVTALLEEEDWEAQFITGERPDDKFSSKGMYLRKEIVLSGEVAEAYACTTALGLYHFYMNGSKVGTDEMAPGWTSYKKHLCYQCYDVSSLLSQGHNTLGAMTGAGWFKGKMGFLHRRNNYGERTAFLMQLIVRYRDGREEIFITDESWKSKNSPVLFSEIYDGEQYDARKEIEGWNKNGLEESGWRPVTMLPFPKQVLTAQAGGKVTVVEELPVNAILTTPEGDSVVDFGQNLTGRIQLRVNAKRGDQIWLRFFETLDTEGNVYTANLRKAKTELSYICRGEGTEEYAPYFTFYGFRYVQVLSWPGVLKVEHMTAQVLYSQMEPKGAFSCSNPLVNQLHHNIIWGMKGNFLDIPTDCPQRDERMGWTGDAQIFCRTSCFLMDTYTFFSKWLKDVAADQTPEGGVPHVVPDIISGREGSDWLMSQGTHSAAAWADVAVINPWTLYLMYGDKEILKEQYNSMRQWVTFMRTHSKDNIWNYKLQFGDWVALDAEEGSYFGATPNDLTCTAYYAYSTGIFAKIACILECEEDAGEYEELYRTIVKKFRSTFFREDGSMTVMTQTAHIIALYFGLVPEEYKEQTAKGLLKLLEEEGGHLVTGFVGTPYFCHALSQNGYVDAAYELLLKEDFPSWLYQVKIGATTVWEHWDGLKPDGTMWSPDMNSFNHYAYGAVGEWLYRVVLGLETDEKAPGYRHSIINPQTGNAFDYAEGFYESPYGSVKVRWEKTGGEGERSLFVTIPHNTTATIKLEQGAELKDSQELAFCELDGLQTAEAGSGQYVIKYTRKEPDL